MPPAQALIASRPFSDVRLPARDLIYVAVSFSFVLICGGFLARRSIARRRRLIHNSAPRFTNSSSPVLLSNEMWRTKKRTSFSPTVSTLVTRSTIVASSALRLKIIPNPGYSSNARWSIDSLCHSLGRSLSWGLATIGLVRIVAASIHQSFTRIISLITSSCVGFDGSCDGRITSLFPALRRPHATRIFKLFPSLRRQPIDSNGKEHTGSPWHLSDLEVPGTDKDEPEPDICVPDGINLPQILRSIHDDTECKTEIPVIPLIILSLPSSDHLVGDPPQPAHQDEHLLSPDGTFCSTGPRARITASTHDVTNATRLALASRLRERRKCSGLITSPNVLAPSMAHWPRWF